MTTILNQEEDTKEYYKYDCEDLLDLKESRDKIGKKSIFSEIFKQNGFKTDIFRISVPSIVLQPVSLLEKFSTLPTPCSITDDVNDEDISELKMLKLVSWLLYNWRNTGKKTMFLVKRKIKN
jgi:hypothetical protein